MEKNILMKRTFKTPVGTHSDFQELIHTHTVEDATSPVAAGLATSRFRHCINVPHCHVETHHFNLAVIQLGRGSELHAQTLLWDVKPRRRWAAWLPCHTVWRWPVVSCALSNNRSAFQRRRWQNIQICWWCIFPTRCHYLCCLSVCATPAKCSLQFEASIYLIGGKQPLVKFEAHN